MAALREGIPTLVQFTLGGQKVWYLKKPVTLFSFDIFPRKILHTFVGGNDGVSTQSRHMKEIFFGEIKSPAPIQRRDGQNIFALKKIL